MYHDLFGSAEIVNSIVELFVRLQSLGMIIPQHYEPIRDHGWVDWGGNFRLARRLARRMGITLDPRGLVDFPSGSMFWARPEALSPLLSLDLSTEDFAKESGQIDGTLAHAIERIFLYACERAGFIWLKAAEPSMFEDQQTIERIRAPPILMCSFKSST